MITDPAVHSYLAGAGGYSHISAGYLNSLSPETRSQTLEVYTRSLKVVWEVSLAISLLGFATVFLEKEVKLRAMVKSDYGIKQKARIADPEKTHEPSKSSETTKS